MLLTVHGRQTYCYTGGRPYDPAFPSLVLLHGAQNDHSVWSLHARALAERGYAVLAPDLPGHGRSDGPALASIEAMAHWLLALLDAAGVDQALLAGHSMGSLIALEAAHRAPHRAGGLALLGTAWPMRVSDDLLQLASTDEAAAIDLVAAWSHAAWMPGPSRTGPGVSAVNVARRLMQRMAARNPHQLFHTDFAACTAYANGEAAARSVGCPTLFVLGRHDAMTPPRASALLVNAAQHGRSVSVDAGHAMLAEAPDAVLAALLDLARRVFGSSDAVAA